jgi:hypothetical protein
MDMGSRGLYKSGAFTLRAYLQFVYDSTAILARWDCNCTCAYVGTYGWVP